MVYRLSWIAGIGGIGFALMRAERLLRPSVDGLPWEVILVAAALLGGAITWAGLGYRLRGATVLIINLVAAGLTLFRVTVPATTWFVFPTVDSFTALGDELGFARDVIRSGVAPVIPLAGIIGIMSLVFWAMGAVLTWGLRSARPYVAVLTPLVVYLEFAVMDRRPSGWWTTSFMLMLGLALIAVAVDRRRDGTGILTSGFSRLALVRSLPSVGIVTLGVTLFIAFVTAGAVEGLVPRSGYLEWRNSSGLSGEFYGSVSYNPFVSVRQQLISQTNVPVMVASVEGEMDAGSVYWRMISLDDFDGVQWHVRSGAELVGPSDVASFEDPGKRFAGDTADIVSDITVLALQMDWLPAPYLPTDLTSNNNAVRRGYRVRVDDGSLRFDALTFRGMRYQVASAVPQPDLDILSRLPDGTPSIVFGAAIEDEEFEYDGEETPVIEERELPDADRYLSLPEEIDPRLSSLADSTTQGLQTDFERGLALESYFRTPGNFRYSTSVLPGHGADDLAAWLLDPTSPNYHTGYCEQFAASMAVLARLSDIPSRVVLGFTPGEVIPDGRVVIRDRNAHAWVELWMPSQGWVRFDPTPRSDGVNPATLADMPFDVDAYLDIPEPAAPPIETGGGLPPLLPNDEEFPPPIVGSGGGESDPITAPEIPSWIYVVMLAGVAIFGLVPGIKALRRRLRLRRLSEGDVTAAWREIVDRLRDLGDPPLASDTPREIARSTDSVMRPLADVYGEVAYGPTATLAPERIESARTSLDETEDRLVSRYSRLRRFWSRYRLVSLTPRWWRRWRAGRRRGS